MDLRVVLEKGGHNMVPSQVGPDDDGDEKDRSNDPPTLGPGPGPDDDDEDDDEERDVGPDDDDEEDNKIIRQRGR
jgi:hypothetical protein